MPYATLLDLPVRIRKLPHHAREIYRKAFNNAWKQYASASNRRGSTTREETAHRVAWNAVKTVYRKEGDLWTRKIGV